MRLKYLTILTSAAVILSGCHKPHHTSKKSSSEELLRVKVSEVIADSITMQYDFTTHLQSNYDAVIQPRVNGYLLKKNYESGMPVKKGDLIFVIESNLLSTTMRAAEAQLYSAQAQLAESKNNYYRAKPLAELNAISQSQLDQYRAEYLSALSSVKSANQSLESARLQVGYSRIYSPIDGIIASSNAHTGDYVGPGTQFQVLTTISNLDTLSAQLAIPTSLYLQYARRGNSYENRNLLSDINLYLSSGEKYGYSGIYDYTKQNISSTSGTISIVVDFPNPNLSLKAGEYAKVKVGLGGKRYKLLIPQQAVSRIQNIASVWVIKPDNTAEYRTVELGESYGQLWIIENGVSLGERVALTGLQKLHNGMKVTPYKAE